MCRISNKPLSEDNPFAALPNNEIFSFSSLEAQAIRNDGKVVCPITGDEFDLDSVQKIYLTS